MKFKKKDYGHIKWYRLRIGKLEFRTHNRGYWIGISYYLKDDSLHDVTLSLKHGIQYQKLPF